MEMYRMCTIVSLILLVSEMLQVRRAIEVRLLKKLAFLSNKYVALKDYYT